MNHKLIPVLVLLGLGPASVGLSPVLADPVNPDQLVRALQSRQPQVRTRGFDTGTAKKRAGHRAFIRALTTRGSRAISVEERTTLVKIVAHENLPSIDMEILFDFNSAKIRSASVKTVLALGKALSDKRLADKTFMIAGHTDAKGSDVYNQSLSKARANAVRAFLISKFELSGERLLAVGFGEEQLKNASDPLAGENRRVQVTNLAP